MPLSISMRSVSFLARILSYRLLSKFEIGVLNTLCLKCIVEVPTSPDALCLLVTFSPLAKR